MAHSKCPLTKYIYKASEADITAADTRSSCRKGRTYDDYLAYMAEHPDEAVLPGDTVEGRKGEKCILTLTWVQWSFQAGFLRDHNNSASVTCHEKIHREHGDR